MPLKPMPRRRPNQPNSAEQITMSMRLASRVLVLLAFVLITACVPRPAAPPPAPPAPAPPPTLPPPTPPPPLAWEDAALSPGDWTYRDEGGASSAHFGLPGQPQLMLRCEPGRTVTVQRAGASAGASLTLRSSSGDRSLRAVMAAASPPALTATLAAADPLLDALVFSRGRFAVEAPGLPILIVPAWPEPARVIEDCRR